MNARQAFEQALAVQSHDQQEKLFDLAEKMDRSSVRLAFEDALSRSHFAAHSGLFSGRFYQNTYQSPLFRDVMYFRAEQDLKNGNSRGTLAVLQLDRPRARPKVKTTTIDRAWASREWKPIEESALPEKVKDAFATRSLTEKDNEIR